MSNARPGSPSNTVEVTAASECPLFWPAAHLCQAGAPRTWPTTFVQMSTSGCARCLSRPPSLSSRWRSHAQVEQAEDKLATAAFAEIEASGDMRNV